ncbi:hypothetical protein, partial [Mesorhizobium sp.]|uniref:hypothetical protein n=1 Tax=Mesorhizobium sp. TaxID=1871066 RepID=UPI002580E573
SWEDARRSDSPDVGRPFGGFQSRSCSVWTKNLHLEIVPEASTTMVFWFVFNILFKISNS